MKKCALGNTGVKVSALCLGAMFFGSQNDKNVSYAMLDQYADAGGMFIDTANIYAHWVGGFRGGESETLVGEWMRERSNRARMFIASKEGFQYPGVERGLTARQIEAECDKSLRRMGIDTIDLYYAHVDDRNTSLEESLEAFNRMIQAGKVRFIGASNFLSWRLEKARWVSQINGWAQYCCIQQRHTYLRPRPGTNFGPQIAANDELLDCCRENNVTVLAYSALLAGAYTRDDRQPGEQYIGADSEARLSALRAVASEIGLTPNQVVLAWMLHSDVLPLIAASTREQMQDNLDALDVKLTAEQLKRLDEAGA
jgi:aryl-alcohol dehydrogenase-like predicted oxidoreductase